MQYVLRFVMFLLLGIPGIFYSAWVFGQKIWPALVAPLAPELFVPSLTIPQAIGMSVVLVWFFAGTARLIMKYGREPELSESEQMQKAFEGYLMSYILTTILWGITELLKLF